MKVLDTVFIAATIFASILSACQNPVEKGKGTYQKDMGDTAKKTPADSTAKKQHVNPEDTIRRY